MTNETKALLGGKGGYGISKIVPLPFDDAMTKVREALQEVGFGVLTEIDVAATLKEKIEVDFGRRYTILGACNPHIAKDALTAEPEIGLLLPCNVVVSETDEGTYVGAISPHKMMGFIGNEALDEIGDRAYEALARAIENV